MENIHFELDASQSGATPPMREACDDIFASAFAVAG